MLEFTIDGSDLRIDATHYSVRVATAGYTSGTKAGSFVDHQTGSRDLGFGLSIVDFLLEPTTAQRLGEPDQYEIAPKQPAHGKIPKRYVEGPQICTQARRLPYETVLGTDFLVVRMWYRFSKAYPPHNAGSRWEQTLIFPERTRYFFSADRVTSVNDHPALILRIDMPGHIKHTRGDSFERVFLSYAGSISSRSFTTDFGPDEQFLYRRPQRRLPEHMIRAYEVRTAETAGPWLAGITLDPADVYEAWCHQRGYVCMIQEIGGRPVGRGQTFGACYCIGWFEHIEEMISVAETHRGWSGLALAGPVDRPNRFYGIKQAELPSVRPIASNPDGTGSS
jgi:hypothetical protein